jgi:hypothetical protein
MRFLCQRGEGSRTTTNFVVGAVFQLIEPIWWFWVRNTLDRVGMSLPCVQRASESRRKSPGEASNPVSGSRRTSANPEATGSHSLCTESDVSRSCSTGCEGKDQIWPSSYPWVSIQVLMISPELLPDVLNRYHDFNNSNHTVHVMKYIFPRQFGLHNVFTSTVDPRETVQPFKDYTLREQEIARHQRLAQSKSAGTAVSPTGCLPKRLRGQAVALVRKLQKLHSRCCYNELLKHYCPPGVTYLSFDCNTIANNARSPSDRRRVLVQRQTVEAGVLTRQATAILAVASASPTQPVRTPRFSQWNMPRHHRTSQLFVVQSSPGLSLMAFGEWERKEKKTNMWSCDM